MSFDAGSLIFPPTMGASASSNFAPAMTSFLIGGVALLVISIITIVLSDTGMHGPVSRAGKSFGIAFSIMVYPSIGAFYALPRTGAISFPTAAAPLTGTKSLTASTIFSFASSGIAFYLCWNPGITIGNLGKIPTPTLLGLLVLLVLPCLASLPASYDAPTGEYAAIPLAAGLLEGYITMDSITALPFGTTVVTSLGHTDGGIRAKVVRRTSTAAIIAGSLLAVVYVGLGPIGHVIPNAQSYSDGASLLVDAVQMTTGRLGQIVFSLIMLTVCMTTAVGLVAAISEFSHRLIPAISYRARMTVFTTISFVLASAGLSSALAIAVLIIMFFYPIAIIIVSLTIATYPLRLTIPALWAFRLGTRMAAARLVVTILAHVEIKPDMINSFLMWSSLQANQLGWILLMVIAAAIGAGIDVAVMKRSAT